MEQRAAHAKKFGTHTLNYVKASVDVIVAIGLLQLAPKMVTPRVTGALGFATSLVALYQVRTSFLFLELMMSQSGVSVCHAVVQVVNINIDIDIDININMNMNMNININISSNINTVNNVVNIV